HERSAPTPATAGRRPPRPDLPALTPRRARRRWGALALVLIAVLVMGQVGLATWLGGDGTAPSVIAEPKGDHAFLNGGPDDPYRWNPCQPIRYEVNLTNAPPGAMDDVHEAIARVAAATGIEFVEVGTTTRTVDQQIGRAFQSRIPGEERFYPLLFEWVEHEHFDFVADTHKAAAFGIPYSGFGDLARTYVSGAIAMDAGEDLPPGFGQRYSRGVVLMHELGHVMGLAHVGSTDEIMWSPDASDERLPNLFQTEWGPGDLEGLAALGREAGCRPAS
ncbi:MAG TPA: hypothetical protein VLE71_03990, partial [Actinomycetota bacterium]|nr:hypothetical protein [Actinomycetota bacterium]